LGARFFSLAPFGYIYLNLKTKTMKKIISHILYTDSFELDKEKLAKAKYHIAYNRGIYTVIDNKTKNPITSFPTQASAVNYIKTKYANGGGVGEILSDIDDRKYSTITKEWGDIHIIPTSDSFWDEIKILLDKSNIKYTAERYDVGTEYFKIKDKSKYANGGGVGKKYNSPD
jgi:hypothetical protein